MLLQPACQSTKEYAGPPATCNDGREDQQHTDMFILSLHANVFIRFSLRLPTPS